MKMQDALVNFNITEYKMFIHTVPDPTMQLILKKLPQLLSFDVVAKKRENCLQLSENTIKIFHSFSIIFLYKAEFSSSTSTKHHIITN